MIAGVIVFGVSAAVDVMTGAMAWSVAAEALAELGVISRRGR